MRVLVLHQHYWPEIAATAQILSDLCEDLVTAGHDVTVVCGQPSYRKTKGTPLLAGTDERRGVQIRRVWSYTPQERGIARRIGHYASYFASSLGAALRVRKPDVCLVMSTPPLLLGVSGTLIHHLRGVPFVYSVQDLYPDIAIHLGVISEHGPISRAVDAVAVQTYRSAAALVTLSPGMAQRLVEKGVPKEHIHVIPNWADTASVQPTTRSNDFARRHALADHFVVQYSGNLGQSQGLEHVIDAAAELRELPIRFAFVGDGNSRQKLEALAKARALHNVVFLPPQPREYLSELLGACDLGLVTTKRGLDRDLVPSKLYGIMAAGRPVLASTESESEVARVVRQHDCGYVLPAENGPALAEGIRQAFHSNEGARRRLGENGRAACAAHFARSVVTCRYEQVLLQAATQGRTAASRTVSPIKSRQSEDAARETPWSSVY